jgi:hypothetical protein
VANRAWLNRPRAWLARLRRGSPPSDVTRIAGSRTCPLCGSAIARGEQNCPGCDSRVRVRSLAPLLREVILPGLKGTPAASLPLLTFAAASSEQKLLAPNFAGFVSVSLFGKYGKNHKAGVDARALTGFADGAFAGHYSCLLFDYFLEHEQAIAEAYRVVAPGGVFFTHIQHTRVSEGARPPAQLSVIKPGPGYYTYIPDGEQMLNVRVGADWFLETMKAAGFRAERYLVDDPCGIACDWFVGWK